MGRASRSKRRSGDFVVVHCANGSVEFDPPVKLVGLELPERGSMLLLGTPGLPPVLGKVLCAVCNAPAGYSVGLASSLGVVRIFPACSEEHGDELADELRAELGGGAGAARLN